MKVGKQPSMKFLLPLIAGLLVITCDTIDPGAENEDPEFQRRELPRELTPTESVLADRSVDFGFTMFTELLNRQPADNHFISPFSISMAYAMALNGAEGQTRSQMAEVFGVEDMSLEELNSSWHDLAELLRTFDDQVKFSIANSAWYRDTFTIEEDFLSRIESAYGAAIEPADFDDQQTVGRINEWVEENTEGRITEIVESIDPLTILFLINAIHFQGDWTWEFDPERTAEEPFYRADGEQVQVPMMSMEEPPEFDWSQADGYQLVDLPYGDAGFVMTLLLPDEGKDLIEVLNGMDGEEWRSLTADMEQATVAVSMPSFELEYEVEAFGDLLESFGMVDAFDADLSDFSGLNRNRGEEIYISDSRHKTFISVDETGTEAAAVTSIEFGVTSAPMVREMKLNRPYFYLIREVESGTALFMGVMNDPS